MSEASDHWAAINKGATSLMVAHAAGLMTCLTLIKDYKDNPPLRGVGAITATLRSTSSAASAGGIGLDPRLFGTHSLRRTKAPLIYRRTGNLRAVQLLLGHTKIESTVRYLGIEVDDALAIAEQVDV
jgi:integrase